MCAIEMSIQIEFIKTWLLQLPMISASARTSCPTTMPCSSWGTHPSCSRLLLTTTALLSFTTITGSAWQPQTRKTYLNETSINEVMMYSFNNVAYTGHWSHLDTIMYTLNNVPRVIIIHIIMSVNVYGDGSRLFQVCHSTAQFWETVWLTHSYPDQYNMFW